MAVEQSAFRYGIRFSATSYVIRITFNGTTDNVTFPASGSLDPTVDYFFMGDGSAIDLCELLADAITAHDGGEIDSTTVTVDQADLELEVEVTPNTGDGLQIHWSHADTTLDATIYGWTNDADSDLEDTLILSPNLPMGLVYLDRPVSVDSLSRQPLVGGISRSISGLTRAATFGTPLKERSLSVNLMPERYALEILAPSNTPYATFESMHVRAAGLGHTIHFIPDATLPLDYIEMHLSPPLVDNLRRDETYRLRWAWSADFIVDAEYVDGTVAPLPGLSLGGGSGGAPTDATYVTMSASASLSAERVLTAGPGITLTDGGANSTATLAVNSSISTLIPTGFGQGWGWWVPDVTGGIHNLGVDYSLAAGTVSTPSPASTTLRESVRRWRVGVASQAGTGYSAQRNFTATSQAGRSMWLGDAAGMGGFFWAMFGLSLEADANTRCHFGLIGGTGNGPASTTDPSAGVEIIAFAADDTDANLQLMHNDATGTATKVDLGIAKDAISARVYDLFLYAEPNAGSVSYRMIRRDAAGDISGSVSTDLPTNTTFMGWLLHTHYPGGSVASTAYQCRAVFGAWNTGSGVQHYGYF